MYVCACVIICPMRCLMFEMTGGERKLLGCGERGFYIPIQDELFTLGVNPMHGCRKVLARLDYGMCLY